MSTAAALILNADYVGDVLLSNEVGEGGQKRVAVGLICGMIETGVVIPLGFLVGRNEGRNEGLSLIMK